jgi:competence protein ComEA
VLPRAAALSLLLAAVLASSALRPSCGAPPAPCLREGRGLPPRHWLGCAADPGPPRDLTAAERLALGLPVDPNTAGERELAFVPGLTPLLARELVAWRRAHGPFRAVDDLRSVKGIGPARLARARPHLAVPPAP